MDIDITKETVEVNTVAERVPNTMPVEEGEIVQPKKIQHVKSKKKEDTLPKDVKTDIAGIVDSVLDQTVGQIPIGVSSAQLAEWKKTYGEIFKTELNDEVFIWHKLRRREYIDVMSDDTLLKVENNDLRIFLRQEKITKIGVLYPTGEKLDNIIEMNAGVAGNISDEIMLASGFRPVRTEKL